MDSFGQQTIPERNGCTKLKKNISQHLRSLLQFENHRKRILGTRIGAHVVVPVLILTIMVIEIIISNSL